MKSEIPILIYSRSSSRRLPFKAFLPIGEVPLIVFIYRRLSLYFSNVFLLTSDDKSDDYLASLARTFSMNVFRGSLESTLFRTKSFLSKYSYKGFFRICGDSPFYPSHQIYELVNSPVFDSSNKQLITNVYPQRTWPPGMSIEYIPSSFIFQAIDKDLTTTNHEHLTEFFYKDVVNSNFNIYSLQNSKKDLSKYSIAIDTKNDYQKIINHLSNIGKLESKLLIDINTLDLIKGLYQDLDQKDLTEHDLAHLTKSGHSKIKAD